MKDSSQASMASQDCNSLSEAKGMGNKKPYQRPSLDEYGKLRGITMAPSPGAFESGGGGGAGFKS